MLSADAAQAQVATHLDHIAQNLTKHRPPALPGAYWRWPFGNGKRAHTRLKGAYIWGGVGRGKSMLMDLFFDGAPIKAKRRVHFHRFMEEVHQNVHAYRQTQEKHHRADPIPVLVGDIMAETTLLCLDEFQVNDITDAMILSRLFAGLFDAGLVLVATSNIPPSALYRDGLNRALFLPFIDLLHAHTDILHLDGQHDHRLGKLVGHQMYYTPHDARAVERLKAAYKRLTGGVETGPCAIEYKKRLIHVPHAAFGIARFTFSQICEVPLAAADYLQIAQTFHTLIVEDIPVITPRLRDAGRRFVYLIDALYEAKVKLIASAAVPAHLLCKDEALAPIFARAASRMVEMRGEEYLVLAHRGAASYTK